jgi:hypothetical protein
VPNSRSNLLTNTRGLPLNRGSGRREACRTLGARPGRSTGERSAADSPGHATALVARTDCIWPRTSGGAPGSQQCSELHNSTERYVDCDQCLRAGALVYSFEGRSSWSGPLSGGHQSIHGVVTGGIKYEGNLMHRAARQVHQLHSRHGKHLSLAASFLGRGVA